MNQAAGGPGPADVIQLRGLRAVGVHGLLAEERVRAQPFEVDLDIELDLRRAGRSDDLGDTVDYGAVAEAVAQVIAGPPARLLEHLAERIARAAVAASGGAGSANEAVDSVTVVLRKVRPPVAVDLSSAGVRIHRSREELVRPT